MRTPSHQRGLLAVAVTAGVLAAGALSLTLQAATNPNPSVHVACTHQYGSTELDVDHVASGPDLAEAGGAATLKLEAHQTTFPTESNGIAVDNYENITSRVSLAGGTVTSASITAEGSTPANVAVDGNTVTVVIPGPVPGGGTITTPEITIQSTVTAAEGGNLTLAPGSPFYAVRANTSVVGAVNVTCEPADATQTANATLTIPVGAAAPPDTTGPTIDFVDPNPQSIYGYQEQVAASYTCSDRSGVASCAGPVANGAALDTSSAGVKDFTVTATDTKGNATSETVQYLVLAEGVPPPSRARYTPLNPGRLLDTRTGADADTVDDQHLGSGPQGGGSTLELQVGGRYDIPSNASGVVLNITATEVTGAGHLTVYPCGDARPTASSLNYSAINDTRPNAVATKLGPDGTVCLYAFGASTHLIADVAGYFPPGARFVTLNPARLFDTRAGKATVDGAGEGLGPSTVGTPVEVVVGGRAGVPANAAAAVLNVTAAEPAGAGHLTAYPCGETPPTASNVNYAGGDAAIPNLVVVKLGTDGKVCLTSGVSGSHLIVDVTGYFPAGADYTALVPGRLLDTRAGRATVDGEQVGAGKPVAGTPIELPVLGRHGIPADALAVVLNVTAADTDGAGYLKVWPCGAAEPLASNVNFTAAGQTRANAVFATIGDGGAVCIVAKPASAHVVVDVAGFVPAPTGPVPPPPPPPPTTVPGATTTTTTTTVPPVTVPPGDCAAQVLYDSYLATYNSLGPLQPILGPGLLVLMAPLDPNGDGNACNG